MKTKKSADNRGRATLAALMLVAVMATAISSPVAAETYDVVINNGRVMDPETMYDDIATSALKDGKIATITRTQSRAKRPLTPVVT